MSTSNTTKGSLIKDTLANTNYYATSNTMLKI